MFFCVLCLREVRNLAQNTFDGLYSSIRGCMKIKLRICILKDIILLIKEYNRVFML